MSPILHNVVQRIGLLVRVIKTTNVLLHDHDFSNVVSFGAANHVEVGSGCQTTSIKGGLVYSDAQNLVDQSYDHPTSDIVDAQFDVPAFVHLELDDRNGVGGIGFAIRVYRILGRSRLGRVDVVCLDHSIAAHSITYRQRYRVGTVHGVGVSRVLLG